MLPAPAPRRGAPCDPAPRPPSTAPAPPAAIAAASPPGSATASAAGPWILSRSQDLLWFHGSVLAGVALLAVFLAAPPIDPEGHAAQPALLALLAWGVLFDGTHVVGTYARSYLAPDPASRAGLPGAWSLVLVALGPLAAVADRLVFAEAAGARLGGPLFRHFLLAASLWAYWHLVRQHWGFVALYRRRAPADPTPARLDEAALWLGCLYPFVRFSLTSAYARAGMPTLLPASAWPAARAALDAAAAIAALALLAAWIARGGARALGPKHAFLAVVIGFHAAVFACLDDPLAITATLTIFHNLQYHRIVWQHEAGRGRRPLGGLRPYLLAGLALGAAWYGPRVLGTHLASPGLAQNALLGLGWGVAFHHYLVDGRIWRLRRNPRVAAAIDARVPAPDRNAGRREARA
jgi:hypothetical protein